MIKNEKGEFIIEHHIKYQEIHGVDETVWMTWGEHENLHHRLRKEGKCNIPVAELRKISVSASQRTEKGKKYHQKYNRRHYQENKEKIETRKRAWREKNKEKVKENGKNWRKKNPNYQREYRARKKMEK